MIKINPNINSANNKPNYNSVNFSSKINIVDSRMYYDKFSNIQRPIGFVDYPWSPKEIIKTANAWTDRIKSCTAGGIITRNPEGLREVVMFHLNPDNLQCIRIENVKEALISKIGNSIPLQALVIGSKDDKRPEGLKISEIFFDEVVSLIKKTFKIPVSKLKGIPMGGFSVDTFYEAQKDEWTVLNNARDIMAYFNPQRKNFTGFANVKLSKLDELVFDEE